MQEVKLMTDSVSGIPSDMAEEYLIHVIPGALIQFDGKTYIDNVNLSRQEAYALIRKDPDNFMTSALTPDYIATEYRRLLKETRNIVHVTLGQRLSVTYKVATMAAETITREYPDVSIEIIDSRAAAGIQGLIVLEAARAARDGKNLQEIIDIIEQTRKTTGGVTMWDTVRYVYRTGRMSKVAARLASLFGIKPISRITDAGNIELVARVKKRQDGYNKLIDMIRAEGGEGPFRFMIMHSDCPEWAEDFNRMVQETFNCREIMITEYSPIMGYATGPGAIFIGFQW